MAIRGDSSGPIVTRFTLFASSEMICEPPLEPGNAAK
jgi:hypothetical protein